jgi:Flp pilus assembly protein TadD
MHRLILLIAVFVVVACGSAESPSAPAGSDTPPVEAQGLAPETTAAADVASCLELAGDGRYEDAVPVCLRAAEIDPDNSDVEEALATSQKEIARARAAGSLPE